MKREDYVSFEVAKLLKEKGYIEYCERFYCSMTNNIADCIRDNLRFKKVTYNELEDGDILIPSLYEVQKWLREQHKIHIEVCIDSQFHDSWFYNLFSFEYYTTIGITGGFNSYEEALNEGIKGSLNYI